MAETAAATAIRHAQAPQPQGAGTRLEVVTFKLGEEEYGIDIQKVQELRGYDAVTRIANAPEYIKGVVNLRGSSFRSSTCASSSSWASRRTTSSRW